MTILKFILEVYTLRMWCANEIVTVQSGINSLQPVNEGSNGFTFNSCKF